MLVKNEALKWKSTYLMWSPHEKIKEESLRRRKKEYIQNYIVRNHMFVKNEAVKSSWNQISLKRCKMEFLNVQNYIVDSCGCKRARVMEEHMKWT